jgi:virginiamycin A acetyltransferase
MIRTVAKKLMNEWTKKKWASQKVRFLANTNISRDCFFEGHNSIGENNRLSATRIGLGTYTSRNTELISVKVGRFCSIGSFVHNTLGRHPVTEFISSHPSFFSPKNAAGFSFTDQRRFNEFKFAEPPFFVSIGNDVWIGDNVLIQDGVTIGDGAIIGANSIVTKDVPPYSVCVGSPARVMKWRFEPDLIDFLLMFRWWEKDLGWIRENSALFADPAAFRAAMEKIKETNGGQ